jgi:hypothetical protein
MNQAIDRRWLTNNGPLVQEFEGRLLAVLLPLVSSGAVVTGLAAGAEHRDRGHRPQLQPGAQCMPRELRRLPPGRRPPARSDRGPDLAGTDVPVFNLTADRT